MMHSLKKCEEGYSITEVLVSLLILSLGMMGASRALIDTTRLQHKTRWHEESNFLIFSITEMGRALSGKVSAVQFKSMLDPKMHKLSNAAYSIELLPENPYAILLSITPHFPTNASQQTVQWIIDL